MMFLTCDWRKYVEKQRIQWCQEEKSGVIHVEDTEEELLVITANVIYTLFPESDCCTTPDLNIALNTPVQIISCCVGHLWKANSGESLEPIMQTFSGVHVWNPLYCFVSMLPSSTRNGHHHSSRGKRVLQVQPNTGMQIWGGNNQPCLDVDQGTQAIKAWGW